MFSYTLHRKLNLQLKIENDEPHKKTGGRLISSCSTSVTRRILLLQPGDKS